MLRPTNSPGKMPESDSTLSLTRILGIRAEAFAAVRHHTAMILNIATGIESVDVAVQTNADSRSIDEQQQLVDAARRLAALVNGCGGQL